MRMALLTAIEPRQDWYIKILSILCAWLYRVCTVDADKFECVASRRPVGRDNVSQLVAQRRELLDEMYS